MIKLFMNGMEVGTIAPNGEKEFLRSEEFHFWKKNCNEIPFQNGLIVAPSATGRYQGIEFSHVIEFTEEGRRIPEPILLPTRTFLPKISRKQLTRAV